jgi:hypothetical protein
MNRRRRAIQPQCFTCRNFKRRCDGNRPYCTPCVENGQDCSGYKTTLPRDVAVGSRSQDLSTPVDSNGGMTKGVTKRRMSSFSGLAAKSSHIMPEDKAETYDEPIVASGSCDSGPSRGRTLERVPQCSTSSRNSSASSARSMIDERMEWANAERSRSFSGPAPEPASPFRESSPFHPCQQASQDGVWDMPPSFQTMESSTSTMLSAQGNPNTVDKDDDGSRKIVFQAARSR